MRISVVLLAMTSLVMGTASCVLAGPFWDSRRLEKPVMAQAPASEDRLAQTIHDELRNGDFEILLQSGLPEFWPPNGFPTLLEEELPGGGSNRYIRINNSNNFGQEILFNVGRWRSILVTLEVRDDVAETQGMISWSVRAENNNSSFFGNAFRDEPLVPGEWARVYATATRAATDQSVAILPSARFDLSWVDADNVSVYTDAPANGGFELALGGELGSWELSGGSLLEETTPLRGARSLRLVAHGGIAEQVVAHEANAVEYFLTGIASGEFLAGEIRLTAGGSIADGSTSQTVALGQDGRFLLESPISTTGQAARICLLNAGEGDVLVDDVSRGFVSIRPAVIEPVANSPAPRTRLTIAWPGELVSARIEIEDGGGVPRETLTGLTAEEGSAWTEYDGGSLEAGVYTVRFVLTNGSGEEIRIERPLEIRRGPAYPARPTTVTQMNFVAIPWIFLFEFSDLDEFSTADQIEEKLRLAADDGFNFLWLTADVEQFPALREATARVGLPFMIYDPSFASLLTRVQGNRTWDVFEVYAELSRFDVFLGSPLFQGIYIVDEPNGRSIAEVQRVQDLMRLMEREGVYPPGYTFQNPAVLNDSVPLNVVCAFEYPILCDGTPTEEMLRAYEAEMQEWADVAVAQDIPFWSGLQGYSNFPSRCLPTEAETRAMLATGLAVGARGYFVFVYNVFNPDSALRGYQFEETGPVGAYREFNARVEDINAFLFSLEPDRTALETSGAIARIARDQTGDVYTFVINLNTDSESDILVETFSPTVLTNVESGEMTPRGMEHVLALGPGDWAILASEGGVIPTRVTATANQPRGEPRAAVAPVAMLDAGVTLSSIAIEPDGRYLAAIDNQGGAIYSLEEETFGERVVSSTFRNTRGAAGVLANGDLFLAGRRWGLEIYRATGGVVEPAFTWIRETGTARDAVLDGDVLWLAQNYWGIDRLTITGSDTATRTGHFFAEEFDMISVFGPYSDGSILAVDNARGIYRITDAPPGGINAEWLLDDRRGYQRARAFGTSRIALPQLAGGVRIFNVSDAGVIERDFTIIDPGMNQAIAADWVSEETLAVADPRSGVRFYHVGIDGEWWFKTLWKPAPGAVGIRDMDALPEGLVAVSLSNGMVVFGDAREVVNTGLQSGWFLY